MSEIRFLVKFGERQFMERMAEGNFYFSHAAKFRDLEALLKKKGQGDYLEGASKIYGNNSRFFDNQTGMQTATIKKAIYVFNYEPANNIPVYCLFTCYSDNCIKVDESTYKITLDSKIIDDIKEHFDKADTAAIITNPKHFISDVQNAFSNTAKTENVHYFHIEGIPTENGEMAQDLEYFKYLAQDTPPKKVGKATTYSFNAEYVYRCLFCKDIFFQNEQEYRILLPNYSITTPTEFKIPLTTPIKLYNINDILGGKEFQI